MATIASGSHAWKGNWADLVNAASAMSTTTAVVTGVCWLQISSARIALRREVPVATTITTTAASGQPATHGDQQGDRKSTRLNSSHVAISYAVFCLEKKSKK